jgi:ribosome-binding factor A
VGEVLRRRLSEVLMRGEVHDPELTALSITVGEVRVSPDLKMATAWVMPLGGRDAEHALAVLRRNRFEIRRAVVKGLELKHAPEIRFVLDDTFDRLDETRRLFSDETVRRDIDEA